MKEAIDEITVAVEALMRMASGYDRGQIIPWHKIEELSGSRRDARGRYIIIKWRKRMEKERDQVIRFPLNVGAKLLTHKETASVAPAERQKRAYRQIRRGLREMKTVDPERLSDHERRLLAAQQLSMAQQRRDLFRSQKALAEGVKVTEVNPRRKPAMA